MGTIKELIRYMLDAHNAYSGTGMMMALYFVALMIIVFYCKDKHVKKAIILPSVLFIIVMYVFVPLYDTLVYYLKFYDGRMFWMLITPIIISIGFTYFVMGIDDDKLKILALILIIPISLYCGEFQISNAMFKKAENAYRLPQSSVDITEYVTSEMDSPKLIVPYTIAHPFRQISTDVHLLYGEDATSGRIWSTSGEFRMLCEEMEHVTPDLNVIMPVARDNNVNYILFDTVYTQFCEDGDINIYGYPIDENYVGDRTSTVGFDDIKGVSVIDDESGIYWDLSYYGLKYEKTFGQYILYKVE